MSGLEIDSASSQHLRALQDLVAITPSPVKGTTPTPSTESYLSDAEKQHKKFENFWEGLLVLFIKIPLVKNLMLFIWKVGLKSVQPSNPIHNPDSLLFSSSIEIPKWFDDQMRQECVLTLKGHILEELKMVSEKAPANLNTLVRLSQIHVNSEFYHSKFAVDELQKGIKETTRTLIQKMHDAHPAEPLQLHLGGHSYESPLKRRPLSGIFIQAFAAYLREYGSEVPIRILHIHGPCDNNNALEFLLKSLKDCPTLYHLHLDLDEEGSKKAFKLLDEALSTCLALEFLVFRNFTGQHKFWVLTEDWDRLSSAIYSHRKLRSLSFYDLPSPPEKFRDRLQGFEITAHPSTPSHGFCIKKPDRLR